MIKIEDIIKIMIKIEDFINLDNTTVIEIANDLEILAVNYIKLDKDYVIYDEHLCDLDNEIIFVINDKKASFNEIMQKTDIDKKDFSVNFIKKIFTLYNYYDENENLLNSTDINRLMFSHQFILKNEVKKRFKQEKIYRLCTNLDVIKEIPYIEFEKWFNINLNNPF